MRELIVDSFAGGAALSGPSSSDPIPNVLYLLNVWLCFSFQFRQGEITRHFFKMIEKCSSSFHILLNHRIYIWVFSIYRYGHVLNNRRISPYFHPVFVQLAICNIEFPICNCVNPRNVIVETDCFQLSVHCIENPLFPRLEFDCIQHVGDLNEKEPFLIFPFALSPLKVLAPQLKQRAHTDQGGAECAYGDAPFPHAGRVVDGRAAEGRRQSNGARPERSECRHRGDARNHAEKNTNPKTVIPAHGMTLRRRRTPEKRAR